MCDEACVAHIVCDEACVAHSSIGVCSNPILVACLDLDLPQYSSSNNLGRESAGTLAGVSCRCLLCLEALYVA